MSPSGPVLSPQLSMYVQIAIKPLYEKLRTSSRCESHVPIFEIRIGLFIMVKK